MLGKLIESPEPQYGSVSILSIVIIGSIVDGTLSL
jgi:hypothetical protein